MKGIQNSVPFLVEGLDLLSAMRGFFATLLTHIIAGISALVKLPFIRHRLRKAEPGNLWDGGAIMATKEVSKKSPKSKETGRDTAPESAVSPLAELRSQMDNLFDDFMDHWKMPDLWRRPESLGQFTDFPSLLETSRGPIGRQIRCLRRWRCHGDQG